jgi:hypothetical protein
MPLLENPAVRALRTGLAASPAALLELLVRPEGPSDWRGERLESGSIVRRIDNADLHVGFHRGYSIYQRGGKYRAHLTIMEHAPFSAGDNAWLEAATLEDIKRRIDAQGSVAAGAITFFTRAFAFAWLAAGHLMRRAQRGLLAQGAASPGARSPVWGLLRRFPYRLQQFAVQCRTLTDTLFHPVPNLRHAGRSSAAANSAPKMKVFVDTRRAEIYLKMLRGCGVIPRVEIERVDDRNEFLRILGGAESGTAGARLLVSRGLFFRYYPDAVPVQDRLNLIVI